MTDTFEFTLNNPLTEEQWDMIADVDFDHTDRIWFNTKHGKEVEFAKVRHGKWIWRVEYEDGTKFAGYRCSVCDYWQSMGAWNYCPNCGARMDQHETD